MNKTQLYTEYIYNSPKIDLEKYINELREKYTKEGHTGLLFRYEYGNIIVEKDWTEADKEAEELLKQKRSEAGKKAWATQQKNRADKIAKKELAEQKKLEKERELENRKTILQKIRSGEL